MMSIPNFQLPTPNRTVGTVGSWRLGIGSWRDGSFTGGDAMRQVAGGTERKPAGGRRAMLAAAAALALAATMVVDGGAQGGASSQQPPPSGGQQGRGRGIQASEYPVLAIGAALPDFSLPGIDGKRHT